MSTGVRLACFATALAILFGAAWAVGSAVGSHSLATPPTAEAPKQGGEHDEPGAPAHGDNHADPTVPASAGLVSTAAGYTFVPQTTTFAPGAPGELAFTITGPDARPVTRFDVEHEKQLHLIVVRRDTAGFQHIHPTLGGDGVWRVPLVLPAAGVYRAFADFAPTGGPSLVLGADLFAPGDFAPVSPPPSRTATVDGYRVRLDGDLLPGSPSQVFATVSKDGKPVTDVEPYLGAFGHLVALRHSDLAYLHVHPDGHAPQPTDRSGPGIAFTADVPSSGTYRLFLDFQHGGVVRTAEFTVTTREAS